MVGSVGFIEGEGTAMTNVMSLPHAERLALTADGRLGRDVPCRACGYNLRGAAARGNCPECGAEVALSIRGDELRYARPEWVATLRRGIGRIWLGVVIIFLSFIGLIVTLAAATALGGGGGGGLSPADVLGFLITGGMLIAAGLYVWGQWTITTPEPGGDAQTETPTAMREAARWALVAGLLLHGAGMAGEYASPVIGGAVSLVAGLVMNMSLFALFRYLAYLGERARASSLAKSARGVSVGIAILAAVNGVNELLALMGSPLAAAVAGTGAGGTGAAVFLGCGIGLLSLVVGLWMILLIDKFKRELTRAAVNAEQAWQAATEKPLQSA